MSDTSVRARSESFASIVWLRAVASLLVVWAHLVSIYCHTYGIDWMPLRLAERYINVPLGLYDGFAVFGVNIFFAISGFIVTHAALGESARAFAFKRALRIYPPLFLSLLLVTGTLMAFQAYTGAAFQGRTIPTWAQITHSLWLLNIYFTENSNINPVAWSLVVEVVFYTSVLIVLPLLKRMPRLALAVELAFYAWCVLAFPQAGRWAFFAFSFSTTVLLFQGQAFYLYWTKRIDRWTFAGVWLAYYVLYIYALNTMHQEHYATHQLIIINTLGAVALFVGLLVIDARLALPRVVRFFADISYSLYLNHAVLGTAVLIVLKPLLGYTIALAVTFAICVVVSWASFRLVERPCQQIARVLSKRLG